MSKTPAVPCKDNGSIVNSNNNNGTVTGFCAVLMIFSVIVGLGLVFIYGYNYDTAHPYVPFTFDVDFLKVNNITTNQPVNGQFRLNLTVTTKEAEFFKRVQVTVEYDHLLVCNTTIAPFHQDALSEKTVPVQMGTAETRVPDKVSDSISRKLASEGVLDFTVIFHGDNWNVNARWGTGYTCDMKMVCEGVRVTLSGTNNIWNGSTKDGPFPCKYSTKGCDYN